MAMSVFELEELTEELGKIRGRHTELISVLIPAGANIYTVANQIDAEKSTADNIKSKTTRKNVLDALERVSRELKMYKQTPENGMAIFCGNVSENEGQADLKLWVIEPPQKLNTRLYRCDQTFVIEPLKEMMDVGEVYGLVVMDRKEATIGLLEGKQIKVLRKLSSGVPGKVRAGGQCLSPDTLIMKENGELIKIEDSYNPLLIISENFNIEKTEETPLIAKWENSKELFKITTCYPRLEIKASKEHTFFIRTEKGIEEKLLSEIKEGDYLLMPEKINLNLEQQKIDFSPIVKQAFNTKKVNIPEILNSELARLFGYYLGDGNYEIDRICFSEQRKEVARYYYKLIEKCFNIKPSLRFRKDKNYYQIRIGSRVVSQLFKSIFEEKSKTLKQCIPKIILKSPDKILASFISGFFDAEGYISERAAMGINNSLLARQLQFILLRLGLISSVNEYDNRRNPYSKKTRYTIAIDDLESLKKFHNLVQLASTEKQEKLISFIQKRSNRNKVRQIVVNGKEVARIIRNSGLSTYKFACPDFFVNKKQISKEVFRERIINKIENPELKRRLETFYLSNLIAVKISKISSIGIQNTIDIETKNHNFLANSLIVHNSSQRFERITEGLAKEFFRRVADSAKEMFFDLPKLKGILVGGPVPTKGEFLEQGQLVTKLKDMIIGVRDIGNTDESGLKDLVEASKDILEQQEIVREKKIMDNFFERLGKGEKVAYKKADIEKALKYGAVETLLLSKKLDKQEARELSRQAENISAKVEIISVETPEGEQFMNIGGMGALLRFSL
ncbi:hypothetical protein HYW76_05520 [Candidatus Pacearchaeota archaeon]|nr:hypothetical protein [Candidatus Pacearchaeota archaeon]